MCLKHWCLLLYKALEGLADGREGLRDSVPVPAEGVMLEEGGGEGKGTPRRDLQPSLPIWEEPRL